MPLVARASACAAAPAAWADEALYWFAVYERWNVDENFHPFAKRAFGKVPAPFRPLVKSMARKSSRKMLHGQGLGRLDRETVQAALGAHLDTLDTLLTGRDWLVGDAPTQADIATFAVVQAWHHPGHPVTRALVDARPALVAWANRVDGRTSGEHTRAWA